MVGMSSNPYADDEKQRTRYALIYGMNIDVSKTSSSDVLNVQIVKPHEYTDDKCNSGSEIR